jgi:hypothetical protein
MTLETKGKSKISAKEVIAARKLKVAHPDISMQAIKDKLNLKLSVIMVGRLIRGISHGHLDMCGLKVRPFEHRDGDKPAAKKATVKKAATKSAKSNGKAKATTKAAKPAAKPAAKKAVKKAAPKTTKAAKPVAVDGKTAAAGPDAV